MEVTRSRCSEARAAIIAPTSRPRRPASGATSRCRRSPLDENNAEASFVPPRSIARRDIVGREAAVDGKGAQGAPTKTGFANRTMALHPYVLHYVRRAEMLVRLPIL